jgi:cation transport ATPase
MLKRKPENPAYLTLQAQLEGLNTEGRALKQRREELRTRLTMIESRLERTPEVERDYLELARDRENTVARYREIKAKLMEAEVAQELEQARKSERFSLIDPAQYPEKPRSPNRPAILLIGVLLALGGGVGSVAGLEFLDSSVRNSKDLMRTLTVPLLSAIPYISNAADRRRAKAPYKWVLLAAVAGLALLLAAIHFLWMPLGVFWFSLLRRLPF